MTSEEFASINQRIDLLDESNLPLWGKMNSNQMICHCTDLIRISLGEKEVSANDNWKIEEITEMRKAGKTIPTIKGFDQVEGGGTQPTNFNADKETLKKIVVRYYQLEPSFEFSPHPFFGKMDKTKWTVHIIWHLDHHLKQFGK